MAPKRVTCAAVQRPLLTLLVAGAMFCIVSAQTQPRISTSSFSLTISRADLVGMPFVAGPLSAISPARVNISGATDSVGNGDEEEFQLSTPQHPVPPNSTANVSMAWSITGLTHRDQRFADSGNQYTIEPADQTLCVGNGYIIEGVNRAFRIYNATSGAPLTATLSLNQFLGFPPVITRSEDDGTLTFGPAPARPSCIFDADTGRFIFLVLTSDVEISPNLHGRSNGRIWLEIASSKTGDPTGEWNMYHIPIQNDGTGGTPDHGHGPALGDFPQIGINAHGFYVTTNEFPFLGGYAGVNIYAFDKVALATGADNLTVTGLYINTTAPGATPAYGLQPMKVFGASPSSTQMYFLSTVVSAYYEYTIAYNDTGIILWTLNGTDTLSSANPQLSLGAVQMYAGPYSSPPLATQKEGFRPLAYLLGAAGLPGRLDSSDTRALSLVYAAGSLWGTFATGTYVNNRTLTGAAVVQINATAQTVKRFGVLSVPNNHLIYPTLAVNANGIGAVGFTLTGADYYPTAAYAVIDANGMGPVTVANLGMAGVDGSSQFDSRPRWGEYGAGAVDESGAVYLGNEFIASPACMEELLDTNLAFSNEDCFGETTGRTAFANWATAITKLRPAGNN